MRPKINDIEKQFENVMVHSNEELMSEAYGSEESFKTWNSLPFPQKTRGHQFLVK